MRQFAQGSSDAIGGIVKDEQSLKTALAELKKRHQDVVKELTVTRKAQVLLHLELTRVKEQRDEARLIIKWIQRFRPGVVTDAMKWVEKTKRKANKHGVRE